MDAIPKITQMRLTVEERESLREIGAAYRQKNATDTVRLMIEWFSNNRPVIGIAPGPPPKKIPKKVSRTA